MLDAATIRRWATLAEMETSWAMLMTPERTKWDLLVVAGESGIHSVWCAEKPAGTYFRAFTIHGELIAYRRGWAAVLMGA